MAKTNHSETDTGYKNSIKRRTFIGSTSAATTLVGLSGCLDSISGGGDGGSETLKIGLVYPRSGAYAAQGEEAIDAVNLAIEAMGGRVGDREVETFVRDSGTSPDVAVPETNKLISEQNIDVLLGGYSSSTILGMGDAASRESIMYIAGGGADLSLTGEKCKRSFFNCAPSGYQFGGVSLMAAQEGLMESVFLVVPDYAGGYATRDAIRQILPNQTNVEIVGEATAPLGADDFSAQISKARDSGADMVLTNVVGGDAITFTTQAVNSGLQNEMKILLVLAGQSVAEGLPPEVLSEIYGGVPFYWTAEGSQEFSQAYSDEFGSPPNWPGGLSYDAAMEMLQAVDNNSGSDDADDLVPWLEGRSFNHSRPETQWRQCDHRALQPYYLVKGLSPSERSSEEEYWQVIGNVGGEEIMRTCSETGCEL